MTIHKSKGLEFPVCYFAGFSSKFNTLELKEKIIYDNKYGLVLPKVNNYFKDTILKTLLKNTTKKEEISEKIRLLYVAVTRAKEKMIIVMPEQEETIEVKDIVPIYERNKYNSFLSIMKSIYTVLLPYIIKSTVECTKDYQKVSSLSNEKELLELNDTIEVEELDLKTETVEESHFSKESLHIFTEEENKLMAFGTKVHEILETSNFKNLDSIEDETIKRKISSFINSDLIKENINYPMYKEYEFIYEENNNIAHGIIDLLIEREDKMIIIDYKLKNINDENYDKQLSGYRKVIEEKTNKLVECYLYSILDEVYRKV